MISKQSIQRCSIRVQTCCFTGHRNIPDGERAALERNTEAAIRYMIDLPAEPRPRIMRTIL